MQYPSCKQVSQYHKTSSQGFFDLFWMQFLCPSRNLCPKTRCQHGLHDGLHLGCHNTQHFQLNSIELIKAAPETTHTLDCGKKTPTTLQLFLFVNFSPLPMWWPGTFFQPKQRWKSVTMCDTDPPAAWHWGSQLSYYLSKLPLCLHICRYVSLAKIKLWTKIRLQSAHDPMDTNLLESMLARVAI